MLCRKSKVFYLLGIIVLSLILVACGKEENEIIGQRFKVLVNGKTEAYMDFGENNKLIVTSAQGKYNAGAEFTGEYKLLEKNNNTYIVLPHIEKEILKKRYYDTAYYEKDSKYYDVSILTKTDDGFKLTAILGKNNKRDFKDIESLIENTKVSDDQEDNPVLIKIDKN